MQAFQRYLDFSRARIDAERQMREHVLEALARQKLIAYGFLLPRKRVSVREKIPGDLFERQFINWEKSSIKGNGLEFVSVTVFRPQWLGDIESQTSPGPIGRPSSKQPVVEAVHALVNEGKLPTASPKNAYELIRARVQKIYPGEFPGNKGLSDKTIAKYLRSVLSGMRQNKDRPPKL